MRATDNNISIIKNKTMNSMKWKIINSIFTTIINPLSMLILAALLSPKEYGLIAVITMIISFSQKFVDMGFSHAIIQKDYVSKEDLNSIFWFVVFTGLVMSVFTTLTAPILAAFYKEILVIELIRYSSIIFLLQAFSTVYISLLKKDLNYNTLTKVNIMQVAIQKSIIILLAFAGMGAISFVLGTIIGIIITNIVLVYIFAKNKIWQPRLYFSFNSLKVYFKFGISVVAQSLFNNIFYYLDEFLITTFFGMETLGLYYFVKNIFTSIVRVIDTTFSQIMFPVLSRLNEYQSEFYNAVVRIVKLVSLCIVPASLGVAITSSLFVPLLFDSKWSNTINLFYYLAVWTIFYLLTSVFLGPIYAKGKSHWVVIFSIIELPTRLILLYFASYFGLNGFLIMLCIIQITKFICYQQMLKKLIGLTFSSTISNLKGIFLSAILSNSIGFILLRVISSKISSWVTLVTTIIVVVILYSSIIFFADRNTFVYVKKMVSNALKNNLSEVKV